MMMHTHLKFKFYQPYISVLGCVLPSKYTVDISLPQLSRYDIYHVLKIFYVKYSENTECKNT